MLASVERPILVRPQTLSCFRWGVHSCSARYQVVFISTAGSVFDGEHSYVRCVCVLNDRWSRLVTLTVET